MNRRSGAIRITRPESSKLSGDPVHVFTFDHIYDPKLVFMIICFSYFLI